jgi:alkylation response protein AidB-like acyl-CoA dehydrogenase
VPVENLVGELNKGWMVAITILMHERGSFSLSIIVVLEQRLQALFELSRSRTLNGKPVLEDAQVRQRLARLYTDVKSRQQYGRVIGSFQGVAYPLVDRTLDLISARSAVYNAAYALDHRPGEIAEAVSMAKAHVSDSYRQAGFTGVQTLGGIGFTQEHDMQLYFRRGSGTWSLFGDPNWHRERLLQAIKM